MGFLLRQPSSGVVIEGDSDGDSIFWNAATREWDVGPSSPAPVTEFDAGASGAAKLIDFQTNGKLQLLELDANCTLSLAAVSRAGYYSLRVVNSGAFTLTLPAGTRIAGGSYTPTPNGEDFLTFYWPGAGDWRVAATLDFT